MPTIANLMGSGCAPLQSQASMGLPKTGLTATGATQGTAALLPSDFNVFTTAPLNSGAILPATGFNIQLTDTIIMINHGANPMTIYPPVGGTIGTAAANTGVSVPAGKASWFLVVGANSFASSVSS